MCKYFSTSSIPRFTLCLSILSVTFFRSSETLYLEKHGERHFLIQIRGGGWREQLTAKTLSQQPKLSCFLYLRLLLTQNVTVSSSALCDLSAVIPSFIIVASRCQPFSWRPVQAAASSSALYLPARKPLPVEAKAQ